MCLLLQRALGSNTRMRIFYGDQNEQMVDNNTDYSGRIEVTSDQQGTQLTIQDVQLSDEREFFCQVNGLAAGYAEGKTHLRVFGKEDHKTQSPWQTNHDLKKNSKSYYSKLFSWFSSSRGSTDWGCHYWDICDQWGTVEGGYTWSFIHSICVSHLLLLGNKDLSMWLIQVASCEVRNGFPKPNITWYRNSMPLMSTPGRKCKQYMGLTIVFPLV